MRQATSYSPIGFGRTKVRKMIDAGEFPPGFRLYGARKWALTAVLTWMADRRIEGEAAESPDETSTGRAVTAGAHPPAKNAAQASIRARRRSKKSPRW
ncbi:hypothetical protein F1188_18245 [Roseospira marina]|uniref:AlpA family phage regulatory protein n=1 Tax=Roseospira marina TaxID=140057 RepID=A0A5M6I782_9PROT|nr:hypothetical protein [Roseospira marina]KAA5603962.1 hypothetical protein F1188_18245 [Roseospira marina]MBB4315932.1 putative DNA-binding transcriptional regulator AlpA [Roseospira marina]MBB5089107.1 putative DNA-binding transcriptional regulator AlpA [Roseospira marina]